MIKQFENTETWNKKINYVDSNNVLIGFDSTTSCCEDFGWYITNTKPATTLDESAQIQYTEELLKDYVFDKNSFEVIDAGKESYADSGGGIVITCIADGKPNLYMVFYNHHNGYYSHGFTMTDNGALLHDISL